MSALLVLTTAPDQQRAAALAEMLVERRLAACVNIMAPCRSVYRWQANVERAEELPMVIKTTRERYAELEAAIRESHPYDVPEIVAVPIERGLAAYLAWVAEETAVPKTSSC